MAIYHYLVETSALKIYMNELVTGRHTDRQTHRTRYSVCNNRQHLRSTAMRPNIIMIVNKKTSGGRAVVSIALSFGLGSKSPTR